MKADKETCLHTNLRKDRDMGGDSGDTICRDCGDFGWGWDWPEKERAKKAAQAKAAKS